MPSYLQPEPDVYTTHAWVRIMIATLVIVIAPVAAYLLLYEARWWMLATYIVFAFILMFMFLAYPGAYYEYEFRRNLYPKRGEYLYYTVLAFIEMVLACFPVVYFVIHLLGGRGAWFEHLQWTLLHQWPVDYGGGLALLCVPVVVLFLWFAWKMTWDEYRHYDEHYAFLQKAEFERSPEGIKQIQKNQLDAVYRLQDSYGKPDRVMQFENFFHNERHCVAFFFKAGHVLMDGKDVEFKRLKYCLVENTYTPPMYFEHTTVDQADMATRAVVGGALFGFKGAMFGAMTTPTETHREVFYEGGLGDRVDVTIGYMNTTGTKIRKAFFNVNRPIADELYALFHRAKPGIKDFEIDE